MKYLFMICTDGVATEAKTAAMRAEIPGYVAEIQRRRAHLLGRQLQPAATAVTVRVRDGHRLVSDGPFAESKEFVAGVDVIEAADLDEAIELAALHPVAGFHTIEVRPFHGEVPVSELATRWAAAEPGDSWMLFFCLDGIPAPDEVETAIADAGHAWWDRMLDAGTGVFAGPLAPADRATTVQVRGGETLLTDGPFVEAEEFIGGMAILTGVSREAAVASAGEHPLAAHHRVEVRRFVDR